MDVSSAFEEYVADMNQKCMTRFNKKVLVEGSIATPYKKITETKSINNYNISENNFRRAIEWAVKF